MENGKELIMVHDTDIKELFMSDAVAEILITTDPKGLSLDESSQVGDIDWAWIVDFGLKGIIVDDGWADWERNVWHIDHDKVTAVIVRYRDADDVETFIREA